LEKLDTKRGTIFLNIFASAMLLSLGKTKTILWSKHSSFNKG